MSPLDAVVNRPGVSIFIVVWVASFRCRVKHPTRGLKWEDEGGEEDGGNVVNVNRGGPILPSLTMGFPRRRPPPAERGQASELCGPNAFHLNVDIYCMRPRSRHEEPDNK